MTFKKAFVVNTGEDSLTMIKLSDLTVEKTIYLSKLLGGELLCITSENKNLGSYDLIIDENNIGYITNSYKNCVMKVDLDNNKLLDVVKVGKNPTSIRAFKGKIYVANSDSNSISIIDQESFTLLEDISVGERPTDILIDEQDSQIFIANSNCYTITILDLEREDIASIYLTKQPIKIFLEGKRLFVLSYINNGIINYSNISEFEKPKFNIVNSIDLKGNFSDFIKIKDKDLFYLSNGEDGYTYKISILQKEKISKIYLGGMPNTIKWDSKDRILIGDILNDNLIVINIENNKIIKKIRLGKEPNGIFLI